MADRYILYGGEGTGAVAVEAALALIGAPYDVIDLPDATALEAARTVNPAAQVPALALPDGQTLTESAAILLRLTELHPQAGLAPGVDDPRRGAFLRWLSFVATQVYAHYWVKDDPMRLVSDPAEAPVVEARLNDRIAACWAIMEAGLAPGGPYLLGEAPSVLDLYVTVISRFRPRRQRFYEVAPRMGQAVRRVDADPRLADLWARRYPFFDGWDRM
ncbi:MAG: glutathione S-transferase family protein [Caulobacterales bacterium]|nr:glutathione S-transferase family protein [Caulobacterales bacterium]